MAGLLSPVLGDRSIQSAQRLLNDFGSIAGVAAAPAPALAQSLGGDSMLAAILAAARDIVETGMRESVTRETVDPSDPVLLEYLVAAFAGQMDEHLLVIFVDPQRRFIAEERIAAGSQRALELRPAALFRRALMLGSRGIVLAHNHPSGVATPSAEDISATVQIAADARRLDIELIDHLIVGGNQVTSMERAGCL